MTQEDPQKLFYCVVTHFIIDAQNIPWGENFPLQDFSSANIAMFFFKKNQDEPHQAQWIIIHLTLGAGN